LVVELVDTADSKSAASRRAGSIPARGTIHANRIFKKNPAVPPWRCRVFLR
jgi:hypothetical protein